MRARESDVEEHKQTSFIKKNVNARKESSEKENVSREKNRKATNLTFNVVKFALSALFHTLICVLTYTRLWLNDLETY